MPYSSPSQVPSYVPKKYKKQWMEVFNSAYGACTKKGGDTKKCEKSAFAQANGVVKKEKGREEMNFFEKFLDDLSNLITTVRMRSISIPQIYSMVDAQIYKEGEGYLTDVYREDNGALFAVISNKGKLYKASIDVSDGNIMVGERQEVVVEFAPVNRSFSIMRSEDDKVRWLTVSATAVLTKSGEIDSTMLFDSFVDAVNKGAKYPFRTFFHKGKSFKIGQCDFIAREGYALITSGIYDDSEIAKAEVSARSAEPEYWGDSIQYLATSDPEIVDIGDGITIPVYRSGVLEEISTLPDKYADGHYTNAAYKQEVKRAMNEREKEALVKLFGGDEAKAQSWLDENVDDINRSITDSGQIARSTEEETVDEETEEVVDEQESEEEVPAETEEEAEEDTSVEREVEIDDELMNIIVGRVSESIQLPQVQQLTEAIELLRTDLTEMRAANIQRNKDIDAKLEELSESAESRVDRMVEDLPRSSVIRATYRPSRSAEESEDQEDKKTYADVAAETLAGLE